MEKPIVIQEESKQHSLSMGRKPKALSKISESSIKESMSYNQKEDEFEEDDENDSIVDEVDDSLNR